MQSVLQRVGADFSMAAVSRWWYILVSLFLTTLPIARGAKILGIFALPARSHNIVFTALTRELAHRGHQVTVISSFSENSPIANLTNIEVKVTMKQHEMPVNFFNMKDMTTVGHSNLLWSAGPSYCTSTLQHPEVQKLIHSTDNHFDAIIVEAFMNECFLGFAHKFNAAIIQICSFGGTHWMGDWVGNPNPFSYVPDAFLHFRDRMNLWERLVNTATGLYWRLGQEFVNIPRQEAMMRKFFNHTESMPPLSELLHNTSLLLLNNHFSLSYPKPMMPNMIPVGGMHISPPNALPQDLQKYLDEASHGVIYFSMGSILQGSLMPESTRRIFLDAFSKLKENVLWKWETDTLPGQPSNVKLGKWLPQSDILAHPNVKLFITHGGLLSKQEAITYGVPLLGIPIFGDQRLNMRRAEHSGYGVLLEFDNITVGSVIWAIQKVLQPSYRESDQHLSRIYRDQPHKPLEQAVFWTEYVIRHKGAPHTRSAVLDLAWYQYFLLDIIVVLSIAVTSFLFITYVTGKFVLRKIIHATTEKQRITNGIKKSN